MTIWTLQPTEFVHRFISIITIIAFLTGQTRCAVVVGLVRAIATTFWLRETSLKEQPILTMDVKVRPPKNVGYEAFCMVSFTKTKLSPVMSSKMK